MRIRNFHVDGLKNAKTSFLDPGDIDETGDLVLLWPTPVYLFRNDVSASHWHRELRNEISQRSESNRSFRADWENSDFFTWNTPGVAGFSAFLRRHIEARISVDVKPESVNKLTWSWNGWVNVMPTRGWHQPHIHEHSTLSFIYYLAVPIDSSRGQAIAQVRRGEVSGGILQFSDPRGSAPYMSCEYIDNVSSAWVRLQPAEGILCVFPSFLSHLVAPHNSEGQRISVAGNIFGIRA